MATLNGFPPNFDPRDFHLDRPHVDEERQKQMKKILLRKKQEDAKRKAEEEERKRVEVCVFEFFCFNVVDCLLFG